MGLWFVPLSSLRALICSDLTRLAQKGRPGSPAIGQHNGTILGLTLLSKPSQESYKESFLYPTWDLL